MTTAPANEDQFIETPGYFYQCTSIVTLDGIITQTIEFEPFGAN